MQIVSLQVVNQKGRIFTCKGWMFIYISRHDVNTVVGFVNLNIRYRPVFSIIFFFSKRTDLCHKRTIFLKKAKWRMAITRNSNVVIRDKSIT